MLLAPDGTSPSPNLRDLGATSKSVHEYDGSFRNAHATFPLFWLAKESCVDGFPSTLLLEFDASSADGIESDPDFRLSDASNRNLFPVQTMRFQKNAVETSDLTFSSLFRPADSRDDIEARTSGTRWLACSWYPRKFSNIVPNLFWSSAEAEAEAWI